MLTSISPFGERARRQRWGMTVTAFAVASTLAGATLGALLAAFGTALAIDEPVRLGVLALAAIVGVMLDAGVAGSRLPGPTRQVDETWLRRYPGRGSGAGVGFAAGGPGAH